MIGEKNVRTNSAKAWLLAARPKTLAGAATPVLIGLGSVYNSVQNISLLPTLLCLFFAFVMQIDANFVNDYFDFKKGTDDETRLGPKRACAEGWITPRAMRAGIGIATLLSCAIGFPLVWYGGWTMVLVGVACLACCFLYTTHLSYKGLGDLLVIIFFGLVPVFFTFYVQVHTMSWAVLLLGLSCGLIIDTLLIVNNFRDRQTDAKAKKLTLIVRVGERMGLQLYWWCGMVGVALAVGVLIWLHNYLFALIFFYLIGHWQSYQRMRHIWVGKGLNKVLGETARNIFLFGVLLCTILVCGELPIF